MNQHENCDVEPLEKPVDRAALSSAQIAYLNVWGMGCPRCATRVRNGLLNLDGTLYAIVRLEQGMAGVAYDPEQVEVTDLLQAICDAGDDGRHHYRAEVVMVVPAPDALSL